MDDLKIITRDVEEMKLANQIIERICTTIKLKINESKSGIMIIQSKNYQKNLENIQK